MIKTATLQLPIYNTPDVDTFNLTDINTAHTNLEALSVSLDAKVQEVVNARGGEASLDARLDEIDTHIDSTSNPHGVTKTQVSLGNVDNTSDANKPVSTAQATAIALKSDVTALTDITTQLTVAEATNVYTLDLAIKKSFTIDITNATAKTIAFSNIPVDLDFAKPVTVKVICSVGNIISTYPTGVVWVDGVVPIYTIGKTYYLTFMRTLNGWHGMCLGAF